MKFEIGKKYLFHLGNYGAELTRVHILAIVDSDMFVYKFWSNKKRYWFYRVEHAITIAGHYERMQQIRKKNKT